MAKDRRNKQRPTLDLESDVQNNLSSTGRTSRIPDRSTRRTASYERRTAVSEQSAETDTQKPRRRRKKKLSRAALIIRWVIVVLVVTFLVFVGILANYIYNAMFLDSGEKVPSIDPTPYDVTPVENENKVAYYLVGVLGENETADTAMLSMVCHDKVKNTVNILQIPQKTYIAKGDEWKVDTAGAIFANPKALDWCEFCRKRLYEPEIEEGEKRIHIECSTEVTTKKGSSVSGVVDFVNDQLGLPVDEFFFLPQEAVTFLVDAVDGIDVNLSDYYELDDTSFDKGLQTLHGAAATDYICYTDGTMTRDTTRMVRQREVFAALLTRLFRMSDEDVEDDIIEELMSSTAAMRTECTVDEICEIYQSVKKAGVGGMTIQLLPGEVTSDADGDTVFSVHKQELLDTLNKKFNPYAAGLDAGDLLIPELTNTTPSDVREIKLNDPSVLVTQEGSLFDKSESEETDSEEGSLEEGTSEEDSAEEEYYEDEYSEEDYSEDEYYDEDYSEEDYY